MLRNHVEYLNQLEAMASTRDLSEFYLWPRTPIKADLQEEIIQRIGISDYDLSQRHSRPLQIIRLVRTLLNEHLIGEDLSILDLPCGDAIVLWQIKKSFPLANCYGLDCNKDLYKTHDIVQRDGVALYRAFLQHLFSIDPEQPFDLVVMLNTYRGWKYAQLRQHEQNLPELAEAWFEKNAKFTVLTATDTQIRHLRDLGFLVAQIGKGEDDSKMICISRSCLPTLRPDEIC